MTLAVALLAAYLHRPAPLVELVFEAGGLDAVAVVQAESRFFPQASRYERDRYGRIIGTSWGLFQLFDRYHPQWRYDLGKHIAEGAAFLAKCKRDEAFYEAHYVAGYGAWATWSEAGLAQMMREADFAAVVSRYNSGSPFGAWAWGKRVQALRDDMGHWLWLQLH